MLIIFDVDGTLVGGEHHDWTCFDEAIAEVTGFTPTQEFFDSLPEITARAIAEASVQAANRETGMGLEERIRDEYLRRLHTCMPVTPWPLRRVTELWLCWPV